MACDIQITSVSGQESTPGQGISILTVSGTAIDCKNNNVCVQVHQDTPIIHTTPEKTAPVDSDGNWVAEFSLAANDFPEGAFLCGGGNKLSISAFCCDDPGCKAQEWDSPEFIDCGGCPVVDIFISAPDASAPCNPDGTRTVELSASVTPGAVTPVVVSFEIQPEGGDTIIYGPAVSVSTTGQAPSPDPWSVDLAPDIYTARVNILSPTNCAPVESPLAVPSCQETQPCPQVSWDADIPGNCNSNGSRDVVIRASISAETSITYSAGLRDPQGNVIDSGNSQNGLLELTSPVQSLLPGNYEYRVVLTSSPNECDREHANTFVIGDCPDNQQPPCPEVSPIDVQTSRNCDNGLRRVRFTTTVTGAAGQSLDAELVLTEPDGAERVVESHDEAGSQSFSYQEDLSPGDYTITLRTTTPTNCGTHSTDFTVPSCNDGPFTPDIVIDSCFLFRLFALLGLGFATLGSVLLLCPTFSWFPPNITMIIGGIMAAAGVLVFAVFFTLWIMLCRPRFCDWLLLGWQAAILIGAVLTYAALCPGCSYLGFGLIGIAAGFAMFIWWVSACRPSLCQTYGEWLLFTLFVLDVVAGVEIILGACVLATNWWFALIWILTLLGLKALMINGLRRNRCTIQF
jgi:hypothetical protein